MLQINRRANALADSTVQVHDHQSFTARVEYVSDTARRHFIAELMSGRGGYPLHAPPSVVQIKIVNDGCRLACPVTTTAGVNRQRTLFATGLTGVSIIGAQLPWCVVLDLLIQINAVDIVGLR